MWQQMLHDDKVYGISEVLILKRGDVFCWQVLHKCGIVEMESLSPFTILQRRTQMHFKWGIYKVDIQPGIVLPQNSAFILGH